MTLLQELQHKVLVADGAMGTLLYSYGVGRCFEELNLSQPDQIRLVHEAYLRAGAQVIQTNTYAANYEKLSRFFGLEEKVRDINTQGVRLAKEVIRQFQKEGGQEPCYVVGALGGIRDAAGHSIDLNEIKRCFQEQLQWILLEGVDGILLETYYDFEELTAVLELARAQTNLPLIAQLTLHDVGIVQGGIELPDAFSQLEGLGADIVGLNCRLGPHYMIRSLEKVPLPRHAYLSAYPNASLPAYRDGRYEYSANAIYFGEAARDLRKQGVRLIGGCCGTTPEHTKYIAKAVRGQTPVTQKQVLPLKTTNAVLTKNGQQADQSDPDHAERQVPAQRPGALTQQAQGPDQSNLNEDTVIGKRIKDGKAPQRLVAHERGFRRATYTETLPDFVRRRTSVIVELDPPKNLKTERFFEGAQALQRVGVDAITLADNSLATPRISNVMMATILKEQFNIRPLVHVTCRDRNLIGLQSHLMGLSTLGIEDVLAITGDPAKVGNFPGASSVYDLSSFELIRLLKQGNEGLSFSGQSLGHKTRFSVAAAFNPNVRRLDKAVQRMEKKVEAGADYFLTQPVYSADKLEEIYEATRHIEAPVFVGIMPLVSHRNAEFLHHEVPGIKLTDDIRKALAAHANDKEAARREGIAIAKSLLDTALTYFKGIYLITPFMHYQLSLELTEYIHDRSGEQSGYAASAAADGNRALIERKIHHG